MLIQVWTQEEGGWMRRRDQLWWIGQSMLKGVRKIELSKPTSSLGKRVWSAGFRTGNVDCWKIGSGVKDHYNMAKLLELVR